MSLVPHRHPLLVLVLLCGFCAGCTSSVTITRWRPAAIDSRALRRLAVLRPLGSPETTGSVQQRLVDGLSASGKYQVSDAAPVDGAMSRWALGTPSRIQAGLRTARDMGFDAVLITRVRSEQDAGRDLGVIAVRAGDATLTAEIEYELVDVRAGQICAQRTINRTRRVASSYSRRGEGGPSNRWDPLVLACADQLVAEIAPHRETISVPLAGSLWAKGAGNLRRGNLAARRGDWREAERQWRIALHADPENHAVYYNLGLLAESRQDYETAYRNYAQATKRSRRDIYRSAIQRVERGAQDLQMVRWQQIPAAPPPSLAIRRLPPVHGSDAAF